jgi:hypothetical protein
MKGTENAKIRSGMPAQKQENARHHDHPPSNNYGHYLSGNGGHLSTSSTETALNVSAGPGLSTRRQGGASGGGQIGLPIHIFLCLGQLRLQQRARKIRR